MRRHFQAAAREWITMAVVITVEATWYFSTPFSRPPQRRGESV